MDDEEDVENETFREFQVQKILDRRVMFNGSIRYLIKWHGWRDTHSWEYEESLSCSKLLEQYKREHQEKFRDKTPSTKATHKKNLLSATAGNGKARRVEKKSNGEKILTSRKLRKFGSRPEVKEKASKTARGRRDC